MTNSLLHPLCLPRPKWWKLLQIWAVLPLMVLLGPFQFGTVYQVSLHSVPVILVSTKHWLKRSSTAFLKSSLHSLWSPVSLVSLSGRNPRHDLGLPLWPHACSQASWLLCTQPQLVSHIILLLASFLALPGPGKEPVLGSVFIILPFPTCLLSSFSSPNEAVGMVG